MNTPTLSPQETQDHAVFTALMWALSRPGEIQDFDARGDNGLEAVGKALLDLETSFFTTDPALRQTFARLGARLESPEKTAYLFFPVMDEGALETISRASVGTLLYPDHAASIVVVAEFNQGPKLHLRGPGIKDFNEIQVNLPERFWQLRDERVSFPLGWDVLILPPSRLVGEGRGEGEQVIAIPRSTKVEVI